MKTNQAVALFLLSRHAKGLSPQTLKWYRGILIKFSDHFKKLPQKPKEIEVFLANSQVGDERRHGYYRALKCFYRFLAKRYRIRDPTALVEPPRRARKVPRILTPAEINKLIALPQDQVRVAIMFIVDTGCRLAEFASLTINDMQETPHGYVSVINGKTGMRIVPINYETYHAVMICPPNRKKDWYCRHISDAFKEAGLKGSAHTLRHTFATLWEGDELVLQRIMGHSSLATTRIYRQLRSETMARQHHLYSPLKKVLGLSRSML